MDSNNLVELTNSVKTFCEERDWDQFHNPKDLAIGICTEASELLEIFRFKSSEEIEQIMIHKKELVENEVADILFFTIRFAQMNNIDLSEAFKNKIKLNSEKYPINLFKGSNKKYNEG